MPLTIPDETLREAGLDGSEALVEFACRLFDAGKLHLWPAAKLAGMLRIDFEHELKIRGIAAYRPTLQDLADDMAAFRQLGI